MGILSCCYLILVVESALFRSTPAVVHIETHALGSRIFLIFIFMVCCSGSLQWCSFQCLQGVNHAPYILHSVAVLQKEEDSEEEEEEREIRMQ